MWQNAGLLQQHLLAGVNHARRLWHHSGFFKEEVVWGLN
jgi:hypothetical protein